MNNHRPGAGAGAGADKQRFPRVRNRKLIPPKIYRNDRVCPRGPFRGHCRVRGNKTRLGQKWVRGEGVRQIGIVICKIECCLVL